MILLSRRLHLHSRLLFCLIFSPALFFTEQSHAQHITTQKKLFVFPAASPACKPQSTTDTLEVRVKTGQINDLIELKSKQMHVGNLLGENDALRFKDSKSTATFNETLHYNDSGQLVNTIITFPDLKNSLTEALTSPFSGFPQDIKEDMNLDGAADAMTLRKEIHFEFAYNNVGQLVQMIMPNFPATGVGSIMENIDVVDTIRLNYDISGRITNMKEYTTMRSESDHIMRKGYGHKNISVDYLSDTSLRCTAVLTDNTGTSYEKTVTDFNFNSKGNLIKATREKINKNGAAEFVSETVYSYYENIKNPEYYALNKVFALAFSSGGSPYMSVNCFKRGFTRKADGSADTTTAGNFSFDANGNIVRYIQEDESTLGSNRTFNNYIYSKNCSVRANTSISEEDSVKSTPPGAKDIDGNTYHTIQIGNQIWMTEDLRVTHFRNGDSIPEVTDASLWKYLPKSAYNKNNTQGYLYNWHAINDPRNIAPVGWHVATDTEWNTLIKNLGGASVAGGALKDASAWPDNKVNTTESGFSALPMGRINSDLGLYELLGKEAYYWMRSILSANDTTASSLNIKSSDNLIRTQKSKKTDGLSVRCVKD